MGAKEKIGYCASMSEIEQILERLEDENLDLDTIHKDVARASFLINNCLKMLKSTETEINNVLNNFREER